MVLDIKKVYIDTRFRTNESNSASDFNIELPRSFQVPEDTVCYIDDIVLPVSWKTLDSRNDRVYLRLSYNFATYFIQFTMIHNNYDGSTFAAELETKLNQNVTGRPVIFEIEYILRTNTLRITTNDLRPLEEQASSTMLVHFLSDNELRSSLFNNVSISQPATINGFIRNTKGITIVPGGVYETYIDLFGTRNLYLTSSTLASYDTISNFGLDTIIKKIPVTAGPNEMIFYTPGNTIDYLNVSKRNLRYIDFKLVDSYFRTVDIRDNHFSFSIIFEQRH